MPCNQHLLQLPMEHWLKEIMESEAFLDFWTGEVCGRTVYYRYFNFINYCMLDYVNCMERYEVWQVAHMGECFNVTAMDDYMHYEYMDDHFLDQYYVIQN